MVTRQVSVNKIVITMLVCHQYAKLIRCQSAYITNDHNSTTYIYEKFTKPQIQILQYIKI